MGISKDELIARVQLRMPEGTDTERVAIIIQANLTILEQQFAEMVLEDPSRRGLVLRAYSLTFSAATEEGTDIWKCPLEGAGLDDLNLTELRGRTFTVETEDGLVCRTSFYPEWLDFTFGPVRFDMPRAAIRKDDETPTLYLRVAPDFTPTVVTLRDGLQIPVIGLDGNDTTLAEDLDPDFVRFVRDHVFEVLAGPQPAAGGPNG